MVHHVIITYKEWEKRHASIARPLEDKENIKENDRQIRRRYSSISKVFGQPGNLVRTCTIPTPGRRWVAVGTDAKRWATALASMPTYILKQNRLTIVLISKES